ncbi:hypothetical protein SKAU_G00332450 [Synaphobranchus kaupii]|uniref:Uncharacterized protein n=1 Tax=Synaphobranchus kaupii TaxID=118154 RepID=A0A9Q1ELA3_SYNKA|nr:hypothetical protein SKAU_G00332450 [Synaphobranchus kaupii]
MRDSDEKQREVEARLLSPGDTRDSKYSRLSCDPAAKGFQRKQHHSLRRADQPSATGLADVECQGTQVRPDWLRPADAECLGTQHRTSCTRRAQHQSSDYGQYI